VVFLDPDNGLAPDSVELHHDRARKYAFLTEIASGLAPTQSLVLYQHICRQGPALQQLAHHQRVLAETFPARPPGWALRFRRGTSRAFLIVPSTEHAAVLWERATALLAGGCGVAFLLGISPALGYYLSIGVLSQAHLRHAMLDDIYSALHSRDLSVLYPELMRPLPAWLIGRISSNRTSQSSQ
jgi:hypothetical protein